jgi:hypothetical protein
LNEDSKVVVQEVLSAVKEMFANESGEVPPELSTVIDNIDIDNVKLDSAGEAINGIAVYIEKTNIETESAEPVTQDEVDSIINGLVDNIFVLDMLPNDDNSAILDVSDEDKVMFENAINKTSISDEDKNNLKVLFGIN